jgi:hypothetical protein
VKKESWLTTLTVSQVVDPRLHAFGAAAAVPDEPLSGLGCTGVNR